MIKKLLIPLVVVLLALPMVSAGEVIDASDYPTYWSGVIQYIGEDNLIIENYTIYNVPFFGIYIKDCNNVIIRNCSIYNSQSSGIIARYCSNVSILNCRVIKCCQNGNQEGITLQDVDRFKVLGCVVIDSQKEGIDAKSGSSNGRIIGNLVINCKDTRPGIYVDAYEDDTRNVDVSFNCVLGTGQGISLATEAGGTLYDIQVNNNFVDVESNAFSIHRYTTNTHLAGGHMKDRVLVYHNIFKSRGARSVHITEYPENFGLFYLWRNVKLGPIVWIK